ncbi:MAG: transcriptional regulator, partial [Rhodospirillaceae bacterium]|nr:transcriptional regulator [Rhodospirillaceae bacterium]
RISIGDIVRSVKKMETTEDPLRDETGSDLGVKVVRPMWLKMQADTMARLDKIDIDSLCLDAQRAGIESEGRKNLDFTI